MRPNARSHLARVRSRLIQVIVFPFVTSNLQRGYNQDLCYESFIRGAVAIVKDHKIVMVNLISYDLDPRLLDQIDIFIFKREIKARRWEAVDMR